MSDFDVIGPSAVGHRPELIGQSVVVIWAVRAWGWRPSAYSWPWKKMEMRIRHGIGCRPVASGC